jgi:hypothetical protein
MKIRFAVLAICLLLSGRVVFADTGISDRERFDRVTNRLTVFLSGYGLHCLAGEFMGSDYARFYATWRSLGPLDAPEYERYAELFIEEWRKYPKRWIQRSGVKAIAFVKGLCVTGQYRAAMPDNSGDAVYYDIGYRDSGEDYERECVHHEFFHIADRHLAPDRFDDDPGWRLLNVPGFKYGAGGWVAYDTPDYDNKEHPGAGFLNHYSTLGLCEDRAEIYASLFTAGYFDNLEYWCGRDPYLARKTREILSFIGRVCPEITLSWIRRMQEEE